MSSSFAELQSAPSDEQLAAVAEAVEHGSSVESVRRLEGGLGNGMHVVELRDSIGQRRRVVLRRLSEHGLPPSDMAVREWRVLKLMRELGIKAPEPLFLDADGSVSGSPAIIISFIDGKPVLRPSQAPGWANQVAAAIWELHSAQNGRADVSFLGPSKLITETVADRCADVERFRCHPLGERLRGAMLEAVADISPARSTLVHGDYWPGNILWRDGRLLAVVDWTDADLRDPAVDIGYMWMDLMIKGEHDAAEEFTERYERLNEAPVRNLRVARMLALSRAIPDPGRWLPGWVALGRANLQVEDVRRNCSQAIRLLL